MSQTVADASSLYEEVRNFSSDTKTLCRIDLFDWIAALMMKNPIFLPTKAVMPYLTCRDGVQVIRFAERPEGCIKMCWNNVQQIKEPKPHLMYLIEKHYLGRSLGAAGFWITPSNFYIDPSLPQLISQNSYLATSGPQSVRPSDYHLR